MEYFVYLVYPALLVFLFWGVSVSGKNSWNEEVLSLRQTKALQGFFAVIIMLHHLALCSCDKNVEPEFFRNGLQMFLPMGYLCVAIFFFCSGFGLYKSFKEKPDYMKGFLKNRAMLPVVALVVTSALFGVTRASLDEKLSLSQPFQVGGMRTLNPYGWYIYAIVILYIGFSWGFSYCRNEKIAFAKTILVAAGYMLFCIWWLYGDWWYNTVPLFIIGMFVAKYEPSFLEWSKKWYILLLPLSILLFAGTFYVAENTELLLDAMGVSYGFDLLRTVYLIAKMTSAIFFVWFVIMFGLKVRVGNKALKLMGGITLEFYLIHGLFVQMFSYCFLDETIHSVYYIENIGLHAVVVFVLSVPLSLLIRKLNRIIINILEFVIVKGSVYIGVWKVIYLLILVAIIGIPYLAITSRSTTKELSSKVSEYADKNITFAEVDGKKMGTYIVGEGEETIVILPSMYEVCPTIAYRALAQELSKNYRVIVLDYLGTGFSDDTDKERSVDNLVDEIHQALDSLGVDKPVILMPYLEAGVEALRYSKVYKEEVSCIVGLDAYVPARMKELMRKMDVKQIAYNKNMDRSGFVRSTSQKFLNFTGLVTLQVPIYDAVIPADFRSEAQDVYDEIFKEKFFNDYYCARMLSDCENNLSQIDETFDDDMPVLMILDRSTYHEKIYGGFDWNLFYKDMTTNEDIQQIIMVSDSPQMVFYDMERIARQMDKNLKR